MISHGKWFAIVVSAILFAVLHNPQTIYLAFAAGIVFAIATLNSGALWISTIAHASYNLSAQIDWRCLNGHWNPSEVTSCTISAGALGLALMLASLLLVWVLISQRVIGPPKAAR
jgi:membrane protease YdiL (CAAX protease family)